MVKKLYKLRF